MEEEGETSTEENKNLFGAVAKGDKELVKALLQKENQNFELDIDFNLNKVKCFN